ncbi:MAG: hypothetical protein MK207_16160, partial [Saprospiraceae bacterium]|nr:hypothetical protein [Saprospiraceae bacterium]
MQELKSSTQSSAPHSPLTNNSKYILRFFLSVFILCITFGDAVSQICIPAPTPYLQTFSTGQIPTSANGINCWSQSVTTGDGWRFSGLPGYDVAQNGRADGTYAWIDFSGTDVGVVLEVEEIDVSSLVSVQLTFDYYSDPGSNTISPANQLYLETRDQSGNWILAASYTTHTNGWETQVVDLTGLAVSGVLKIRFRGESGGHSQDFYNDILLDDIAVSAVSACIVAPFIENFDGASLPNCWSQETADIFDWTLDAGGTPSVNTGPSDDMSGGGNYMYIETSSPRVNGDDAVLYLSDVDISSLSSPELRFYSHMYGTNIATLNVEISTDGGSTYTSIFTKSGNQGNLWNEEIVDLSSFSGIVKFKITGIRGSSWAGDIAIDNFEVREATAICIPISIGNPFGNNVTASTAMVDWSWNDTQQGAYIEWGPSGFIPGTGTSAIEPYNSSNYGTYTLNGLSGSTAYDVYIRALCGPGDTSDHVVNGISYSGPISFTTAFSCAMPGDPSDNFNPVVSNISTTSAELSWIENGTATQWMISYGVYPGPSTNYVVVNSNPYTITGLSPNETYGVSVRSICSPGDTSYWSGAISFTTIAGCALSITDAGTTIPVSCYSGTNSDNGSYSGLIVSGGTAPYQYDIGFGNQASSTFTGLTAGSYIVTATDASGCTTTNSIVVNGPSSPIGLNVNTTDILCHNPSSVLEAGTISAGVSGGWSSPPSANHIYTINGVVEGSPYMYYVNVEGTFTIIVEDTGGSPYGQTTSCYDTSVVYVDGPDPMDLQLDTTIVGDNPVSVSCYGDSDGSAQVHVQNGGGTPPYSIQWMPSAGNQTTWNATGLAPGSYVYMVTDDNGCQAFGGVTISEPAELSVLEDLSNYSDESCYDAHDGVSGVMVSGGTTPYSYLLNGDDGSSYSTPYDYWTHLSATVNYTLVVTDARNCTETFGGVSVYGPLAPLSLNLVSATNPTTIGGTDGEIDVSSSVVGYPAITADQLCISSTTISPQSCQNVTGVGQMLFGAFGYPLPADTYTITGGIYSTSIGHSGTYCPAVDTIVVTLTDPCNLTATASITDADCAGNATGAIDLTVNGGAAPYTYIWSGPNVFTATTEDISNLTGTSNLGGPSYDVTITDDNGCAITHNYTVYEPVQMSIYTSNTYADESCYDAHDGMAGVDVFDGTAPYSYLLNGDDGSSYSTPYDYWTHLSATVNYTLTVTDANNCMETFGGISVNGPLSPLTLNLVSATNPTTIGGTDGEIHVSSSGGGPPGASADQLCISSSTISPQSCQYVPGEIWFGAIGYPLPADTYTITGGIFSTSTGHTGTYCPADNDIVVTLSDVCALTISNTGTTIPVSCYSGTNSDNGSYSGLTVSGGIPPYQYDIGSGNQSSSTFTGLTAGNYTVTVTDANGCSVTNNFAINGPSSPAMISVSTTDLQCYNPQMSWQAGTISASGYGGWGGSNPSDFLYKLNGNSMPSTLWYANVEGFYNIEVEDWTCFYYGQSTPCIVTTQVYIDGPDPIDLQLDTTVIGANPVSVSCFGDSDGSAQVHVQNGGGTPPYSILWMPSAGSQTTWNATGLPAGTHFYSVTDDNGCEAYGDVTINEPAALSGTDIISACGSYTWIDGNTYTASNNTATHTLTNTAGCDSVVTLDLTISNGITVSVSGTDVSCFNGSDGSATANVSGGTAPYTYLWDSGQNTQSISNKIADGYYVTVTDANGCTGVGFVLINEPTFMDVQLSPAGNNPVNVSCNGGSDGSAQIVVFNGGGSPPYQVLWGSSAGSQTNWTANNLAAGNHSYTVTDANGCISTGSVSIWEPSPIIISPTVTDATCNGNDGTIMVTASPGGMYAYYYDMEDASSNTIQPNINGYNGFGSLPAGVYTVTATDYSGGPTDGCSATTSVTVNGSVSVTVTDVISA